MSNQENDDDDDNDNDGKRSNDLIEKKFSLDFFQFLSSSLFVL